MLKLVIALCVLLPAVSPSFAAGDAAVWAQINPKAVVVVDGDTLVLDGRTVQLYGINAPALSQTCRSFRTGKDWPCGQDAVRKLRMMVGVGIVCRIAPKEPSLNRTEAICFAGPFELNAEMVIRGWAVAEWPQSAHEEPSAVHRYMAYQEAAEDLGAGIWASVFEPPERWSD